MDKTKWIVVSICVGLLGLQYYYNSTKEQPAQQTPVAVTEPAATPATTPAAPPRKYVYCSDTKFNPNNVQYTKGADLLFHEATFAEDRAARAEQTCHSTARQAAEMARLSGAKQLLIGHYSARYTDERVLLDEAREVFPNTLLAEEGKGYGV